jgi:hypothetical protein
MSREGVKEEEKENCHHVLLSYATKHTHTRIEQVFFFCSCRTPSAYLRRFFGTVRGRGRGALI